MKCVGRMTFVHVQRKAGANFFAFWHQHCIKSKVVDPQDFDIVLALVCKKDSTLPEMEVYKHQFPLGGSKEESLVAEAMLKHSSGEFLFGSCILLKRLRKLQLQCSLVLSVCRPDKELAAFSLLRPVHPSWDGGTVESAIGDARP